MLLAVMALLRIFLVYTVATGNTPGTMNLDCVFVIIERAASKGIRLSDAVDLS